MKIKFLRLFILCLLAIIIVRLFYWQIIKADVMSAKAESQRVEELNLMPQRGNILYSDKFILASSKPSFLIYGLPKILTMEEKAKTATVLAKILATRDEKEENLKKIFVESFAKDLFWVPVKNNIDIEIKKKIATLSLKGIGFEEQSSRFYPEASTAATFLGFVAGNSKGENTGYFGLEGAYNGELKGFAGQILQEKDSRGLLILSENLFTQKPQNGKTLILNIDRIVQYVVEQSLKKGIEKYGAKAASAVVMDPKTGAILAMASYPSYDPLNFIKFDKEFYKNKLVADQYEPGSTFKILVMAAALNEDVIKLDTKCDICEGPVEIGGFTIKTWNNKYFPETTPEETIIHSDNTGMVFVGKKLGLDKMYSYLENFGFGQNTGVDLQDESSPDLRPKDSWREIDLATVSFGQGIAITPIQMITAVASIANGGNLMEPQMVREIKDEKSSYEVKPKLVKKVLKEETTKIITEMMTKAVNEGESKWAKPKGFKIAGKTGTAQIPVAGHYDPNKTIASFVGFAPADNPKFVMLVRYDEPSSSIFGADTAAPTFFEIAKELFNYYKIAPTE